MDEGVQVAKYFLRQMAQPFHRVSLGLHSFSLYQVCTHFLVVSVPVFRRKGQEGTPGPFS